MPSPQNKLIELAQGYVREADSLRERFIPRAEKNNHQYLGNYDYNTQRGHSSFVVPKTQKSTIALTSVQIEQRPRIVLKPRENALDDELFMTRKGLMTIERAMDDGVIFSERPPVEDELGLGGGDSGVRVEEQGFDFSRLTNEPDKEAFPVSPAFVERVTPMLQPMVNPDDPQAEPSAPLLRPEDFLTLNDSVVAKVLQNNLDILWDEDDGDQWAMDSLLNNNILGWQPSLYLWDKETMRDKTKILHIKDVWIDPNGATRITEADYAFCRELVTVGQAKEQYPDAADKIAAATAGHEMGIFEDCFSLDATNRYIVDRFERPMVYIWTFWVRNERYDMSVEDAIEFGRVAFSEDGETMFLADEDGIATETPVKEGGKGWPKRRGIRQFQIVGDSIVSDMENKHKDIPIIWMKNIPEAYKPYGIGEPDALEWIDALINKMSSILFDHFKYYRSWSELYPSDVWESLKEFSETRHAHPGRQYAIESNLYEKYAPVLNGGKGFMVAPPPMPESAFQMLQMALTLHDDISGNTEALQGRLPSASTSGRALETLQSAAKGVVGFKSIQTEHAIRQLTRLRVHAMNKWLPLFMWKKWNDQFPKEILDAVRLRAKNMEWEVGVEVVSGGGQVREQLKNEVRNDYQAGIVSPTTAQERLGYDPDIESERLGMVPNQNVQGTQVNEQG